MDPVKVLEDAVPPAMRAPDWDERIAEDRAFLNAPMSPPNRLSADRDNPAYDPYWVQYAHILLDGERITRVLTVDVDEGWADVLVYPIRWDDQGKYVTERVVGSFEIRPMENRT